MFGAIHSNEFQVRDVDAFFDWLEAENISWCAEDERGLIRVLAGDRLKFHGKARYPNALPKTWFEQSEEWKPVDVHGFCAGLRRHLAPGAVACIMAGGPELDYYLGFSELIVTGGDHVYQHAFTDDTDEQIVARLKVLKAMEPTHETKVSKTLQLCT